MTHRTPKLAVLASDLSDRSGGVAESVPGMCNALATSAGADPHVVGLADGHSGSWAKLGNRLHPQRRSGPRPFGWSSGFLHALETIDPEIVDVQGLWMGPSLASSIWHRRAGRPYMITPRGMLDPWALEKSAWKKAIAGILFESRHLREACCLRALNLSEARSMRAFGLVNPICIVPNGIDLPPLTTARPDDCDERELLFLGRLDPKKGVAELIEGWSRIASDPRARDWHLRIVGWGEPGYVARTRELVASLGEESRIRLDGPAHGEAKHELFRKAHGFILPSKSEGLPMAVLEAWSHGLPSIISEPCNLDEALTTGAALRTGTDPAAIARAIDAFLDMGDEGRRQLAEKGRALVEERFSWSHVARQLAAVYRWLLDRGPEPDCILPAGSAA